MAATRTVATRMVVLGVQPHVVEAVLNHVSGHKAGVAGVYIDQATLRRRRRRYSGAVIMVYAKPKRTKQEAARIKADLFAFHHSSWKKDRSGILTFMRLLSRPLSAQQEAKAAAREPHWRLVEDLGQCIPQNDKLCPPDELVAELIRLARMPAANTDEGIEKRKQLQQVLWFDIEREWRYRDAGGKRGMLKKIGIEERCLARLVRVARTFCRPCKMFPPFHRYQCHSTAKKESFITKNKLPRL
jgi:hypothetical protein